MVDMLDPIFAARARTVQQAFIDKHVAVLMSHQDFKGLPALSTAALRNMGAPIRRADGHMFEAAFADAVRADPHEAGLADGHWPIADFAHPRNPGYDPTFMERWLWGPLGEFTALARPEAMEVRGAMLQALNHYQEPCAVSCDALLDRATPPRQLERLGLVRFVLHPYETRAYTREPTVVMRFESYRDLEAWESAATAWSPAR